VDRQRRKGRKIAGFAALLLCAFLAGCGAEAAPSYTKQGMEAVESLDYEKALALFQTAEENGEEKRLLYRGMGLAYLGKTDYEAAIAYLEAALRLGNGRVENLDFDILPRHIIGMDGCRMRWPSMMRSWGFGRRRQTPIT
jgi:tetratricopeptide (TPR) repeat protein